MLLQPNISKRMLKLLMAPLAPKLTASLKQGFAQMSQDLSKTIAESFKLFQSELEIQYEDIAGVEQEETP